MFQDGNYAGRVKTELFEDVLDIFFADPLAVVFYFDQKRSSVLAISFSVYGDPVSQWR